MTPLIVALMVLGAASVIAEAHLPTYGVLGVAGVAALVAGAVLAVLEAGGGVALALAFALPVALAGGALLAVAVPAVRRAARTRPHGGADGLVGHVGVVRRAVAPEGAVLVDGALWRARRSWAEEDEVVLGEGEPVVVERVQGLTLSVRRAEEWEVI
jgi:membrane-bound ClpP family serine protease